MTAKRFKDPNFKLACLDTLFELGKLKTALKSVLKIPHVDDYSEEVNKKRYAAFKKIPLTQTMLDSITEFQPDGGDEIYFHIMSGWAGSQSELYITSSADMKLLRNLESLCISAITMHDFFDLRDLRPLKKLKSVIVSESSLATNYDTKSEIADLESRGVKVEIP